MRLICSMVKRFRTTFALYLVALFLLPAIVKFGHHHTHFELKDTSERQFQKSQEKCSICTFELTVFFANTDHPELPSERPTDFYFNHYNSQYNFSLSQYSFLLRAPPVLHV